VFFPELVVTELSDWLLTDTSFHFVSREETSPLNRLSRKLLNGGQQRGPSSGPSLVLCDVQGSAQRALPRAVSSSAAFRKS
jgi:hypothetical protein